MFKTILIFGRKKEESHCIALSTFSIVVLTEDRLEDRVFSVQWKEFKPLINKELYVIPKIKRAKKINL